jgi:hypothetical protein
MKAHIVENGVVVNTIVVETLEVFPNLIDAEFGGSIGDLWDGKSFTPAPKMSESDRILWLWKAARNYENDKISGTVIGIITIGVMQSKTKCLAVQNWINSIWVEYYKRKAGGSFDMDFSPVGQCPHSVPELVEELGP